MIPLISVIIPAYNSESYISDCLESVLNQTYKNLQVIVINDGSTDKTCEIAELYAIKDERIQLITTENGGVSRARNRGILESKGEYLVFVDSDDTLPLNSVEILLHDITVYSADIAAGVMDESFGDKHIEVWTGNESVEKYIQDNPFIYSSCAKIYRRSFIADTLFPVGKKIHEDTFFQLLLCLKAPRFVVHNVCVYYYRRNAESASNAAFSEKFLDIIDLAHESKKLIDAAYPEFKEKTNAILLKSNLSLLNNLCKASSEYNTIVNNCIWQVKTYKKYFIPIYKNEKPFFWIVTHNLYYVYRWIYRLKFGY